MNTLKYNNLIASIGKHRLEFLSNPGYRANRGNNWVAMYMPQFHQIWTNPFFPKSAKNKALVEEFCHSSSSRARPMQLLPVINWLDGNMVRPDTDDFRDIAEVVVIALRPLLKGAPLNKRYLLHSDKYRNLACKIIDLAKKLSRSAGENMDKLEASKGALWAVITCLYYLIPSRPDQCTKILAFMEQVQLAKEWKTSHDLFELLIGKTAKYVQQHKPIEVGFTISKPNDPHMLISKLLEIMDCIDPQKHTPEIISSIFPTCLYLLTLGTSCLLPMYWLKKKKHKIDLAVEIWHETHECLKVTDESMNIVLSNLNWPHSCGARKAYHKVFQEVKKYSLQPVPFNPYELFEHMLNIVPTILSKYLYNRQKESSCDQCNIIFYDDTKIMHMAEKFISMPKSFKSLLINSSRYYKSWLLNGSVDQIDYYLRKDFNNELPIHKIQLNPDAINAKRVHLPWLEIIQDE